ncbi:MAG: Hpt domain-containing protein [Candidatus Eisenbacteria bacterium]|uniref:Hpt domain-containing protein n=1 Tax=Eiseniibacteriota bacterium TaxID=2212470 RepID=A0A956SCT1_UNCEI|nr:Hpt domain-containing protein [Candidatus Eisenbacteria bacterium]MCB9465969.1 Hpt domain-containing protein [Candidatus Eisenbacteria bacterium]
MNETPMNDSRCPIDHEHLTDMSAGDTEFETELMQEFLRVTPPLIEQVENALATGDLPTVERAAHTLKGSCRSLGARPMSDPCETLEKMARAGETTGANEVVQNIQAYFDVLTDYITKTWGVRAA